MPLEPDRTGNSAEQASENLARWRVLLGQWQREVRQRPALIAASVAILALVSVGVWYNHFSRLIDKQVPGGPFRFSLNIYGAPIVLSDGDATTANEVDAALRLAGYRPGDNGDPGTFRTSSQGFNVTPSDGAPPVRIVLAGNREIASIQASGRDVKTWTAGYPLLENLSPGREKRHMVTFRELPPALVNAVVSVEDKHFFQHGGLDLPRIVKAAYEDIRALRKEQGASTITMQLVRGLWLERQKKWSRKLTEAMMTVHLERKWSKQEIFAAYANQIYMGRQAAYSIHGFAEASRLYFGKDLRDLSLPEAALLAGMVQRPSYFNPYRNPDRARERRDAVLALMRDNRYITEAEFRQAVDTPLKVASPAERNGTMISPYYLDLASDELSSLGQSEGDARSVYTTIDLNLQRAAGEAVAAGMSEVDKLLAKQYAGGAPKAEAALMAIDPHTGEIKALVGGRDYAHSQLNRIFAKRPPGSVFKPFVYAAAMNTGVAGGNQILTPASVVTDEPTTFAFDHQTYQPVNFRNEIFGALTLRRALAKSDNVAAVKVAQMVGYQQVVSMARQAGLNAGIKATPAVALGSYAVTPFEMAGAYTVFANGGTWVRPRMVLRVENADGEAIRSEPGETRQAMDPRVAWLMVSMLEEVMRSGTAAGVRSRGFLLPAAGKTGTSHDGWFAGFTSQLLCIVWVGFDDYRDLNLEGAKSALPIWTEFMKKATRFAAYRNAREFTPPSGITSARICLESGKLAGDLCTQTQNEVFIAGTEPRDTCDLHTETIPVVNIDLSPPSNPNPPLR